MIEPLEPTISSRRDILKGMVAASLATAAGTPAESAQGAPPENSTEASANPIVTENRQPGTRDWQLTRFALERPGGKRSRAIEGYCSRQSVRAGETLEFKVSVDPAGPFQIDVFRMGFYGGLGARLVRTIGPLEGKPQPVPEIGANRLRECRWETTAELTVPADWISGVFLGRLTALGKPGGSGYWQSYVVFLVRDDRRADLLFQSSDNSGRPTTNGPTAFRSTPTRAPDTHRASPSRSIVRTPGFPFFSRRRTRSVRGSSCCGSIRSATGSSSTATT